MHASPMRIAMRTSHALDCEQPQEVLMEPAEQRRRRRLFDLDAPKRPVNLSVNADLVARARAENLNLSQVLSDALEAKLREAVAARWREENREAIEQYNRYVEEHGVFSERLRLF